MKWIIIITVLLAAVIYSCKPTSKANEAVSKVNEKPSLSQQLKGSWTMHKEICCGRGSKERTGKDMLSPKRLNFSSNNKVTITDLKTKESKTTTYKLEVKNEAVTYIILEESKPKGILRFENNEFVIDYGYMDLQKEFYQRSK